MQKINLENLEGGGWGDPSLAVVMTKVFFARLEDPYENPEPSTSNNLPCIRGTFL